MAEVLAHIAVNRRLDRVREAPGLISQLAPPSPAGFSARSDRLTTDGAPSMRATLTGAVQYLGGRPSHSAPELCGFSVTMSDLVLDAPLHDPRGVRTIVPDGAPGHFEDMKVCLHVRRMAAFGRHRRDPRHSHGRPL